MLSHVSRISLTFNGFREGFNGFRENPRSGMRALAKQAWLGLRASGKFLKTCYVDGFSALIEGRYNRRQAAMIIAGNVPTILGALFITVPGILFPLPGHQAFYYFGSTLGCDPASLIPITLGAVSSTLGLRIPLA